MSKVLIHSLAEEALAAFWKVIVQHFPQATTGDLSSPQTIRLSLAAELAIEEWIANNVPPSAGDGIKREADISALFAYLDRNHVRFRVLGCYVALSRDRKTIFACPMMADGSPDRYELDRRHMNWGEVTAPEPEFVSKVNQFFATSFRWEDFPGK